MTDLKNKIINNIIEIEGDYVNDPADSGGETKYGITIAVARAYGYEGEMTDLPRETAFSIYTDKYWDKLHLDSVEQLSEKVATELADTAVNMGTERAATFLQRSLNVLNLRGTLYADIGVDGHIGPATLTALVAFLDERGRDGELVLESMLNALQGAFYVELAERREKDERFVYGWFKWRVA